MQWDAYVYYLVLHARPIINIIGIMSRLVLNRNSSFMKYCGLGKVIVAWDAESFTDLWNLLCWSIKLKWEGMLFLICFLLTIYLSNEESEKFILLSHSIGLENIRIRGYIPSRPNELWVSDITYWKIKTGFVYISLITDAFSHKVVGSHVAPTLESMETIKALEMALSSLKEPPRSMIHHSDRGLQYCSSEYVKLLQDNEICISMTENGDPLENAIAERINGILKDEYLECYDVDNIEQAKLLLEKVIILYNEERPHMSIGNLTPDHVHENNLKTEKLWKNYQTKNRTLVNLLQDEVKTVN